MEAMNEQFIDISKESKGTPIIHLQRLVNIEEQKFLSKNRKPFCRRCAMIDYRDKFEKVAEEIERTKGAYNPDNLRIDLKPYGKIDRFRIIGEVEQKEPTMTAGNDGVKKTVVVGVSKEYQCKERGCGISIFVSTEDLALEKSRK